MPKARGSVWANNSKKKGYSQSIGSYGESSKGDRYFKLTPIKGGKSREYSSPDAAEADGWFIVKRGK